MQYSKPEFIVLGDAKYLVQGARIAGSEVNDGLKDAADCELDD